MKRKSLASLYKHFQEVSNALNGIKEEDSKGSIEAYTKYCELRSELHEINAELTRRENIKKRKSLAQKLDALRCYGTLKTFSYEEIVKRNQDELQLAKLVFGHDLNKFHEKSEELIKDSQHAIDQIIGKGRTACQFTPNSAMAEKLNFTNLFQYCNKFSTFVSDMYDFCNKANQG